MKKGAERHSEGKSLASQGFQKSVRLEDGVHGGACVWRAGSFHTDFTQGFVQRGMKSYHASEQKHHVIRSVSERARLVRTSSGKTREGEDGRGPGRGYLGN